uniref:Uncharacterized protein n=1 Tax=Rhodopseudomonas palustris (strain BisA53) TaxID=316055 RepID=Q07R56_RHOP5
MQTSQWLSIAEAFASCSVSNLAAARSLSLAINIDHHPDATHSMLRRRRRRLRYHHRYLRREYVTCGGRNVTQQIEVVTRIITRWVLHAFD